MKHNELSIDEKIINLKIKFIDVSYNTFLVMCIFLPIVGIDGTLYRFPRNLTLLALVSIAVLLELNISSKLKYKSVFLLLFIMISILEYYQWGVVEEILENFML